MNATIEETDLKLSEMLTENTGSHMLDSGGAYGRHHERNRGKTIEDFMAAPRATIDKYGCVTLSAFHFLRERLDYAPEVDAEFQAFAAEYPNEGWLAIMEAFGLKRQGKEFEMGEWRERREGMFTENTYNIGDMLTQTLQFTAWEDDEDGYVALQIHGGCDVRGGYTTPVVFRTGGMEYAYELLDCNKFEAGVKDRDPIPEGIQQLDGTSPSPDELDPVAFTYWTYDAHYGWDVQTPFVNGSSVTLPECFNDGPIDENCYDEETGQFRSPDGNGWVWVDMTCASG